MSGAMPVRILVQSRWDQVTLELPATTPVDEAKRKALQLTYAVGDPADYLVKHRGAEVLDENQSLADAGVPPNGALIVLPRRRQPVR